MSPSLWAAVAEAAAAFGLHDRMRQLGDMDEARRMFVARQPMGRLANPEEIIPIVIYLASDESAFATGQMFNVDGGMTI